MATEVRSRIVVRKPLLRLAEAPRYYLTSGNPISTHFFNALNLLFPDGERFFVRAVHDRLDRIRDPVLRADAKAFAGQEGQHAREHEAFFEVLENQGYRIRGLLEHFRRFNQWCSRRLPASLRLSMTAGAEHYTATLGGLALETGLLEDCHPAMRELITWHAIEEIEHKNVAFDVLKATHPSYLLRILGFFMATFAIGGYTARGLAMFIAQDRIPRAERVRYRKELQRNAKLALFRRRLGRALWAYLRPSFHPSQVDDQHLIVRYGSEIRLAPA
jgi:predicted metal-dependent hydrolase